MVVVLPAPLGPRKATTSPGRMLRSMSSTAVRLPKLSSSGQGHGWRHGCLLRSFKWIIRLCAHDFRLGRYRRT